MNQNKEFNTTVEIIEVLRVEYFWIYIFVFTFQIKTDFIIHCVHIHHYDVSNHSLFLMHLTFVSDAKRKYHSPFISPVKNGVGVETKRNETKRKISVNFQKQTNNCNVRTHQYVSGCYFLRIFTKKYRRVCSWKSNKQ